MRATAGRLRAWHGSWRDTFLIDVLGRLPQHHAGASTIASDVLYQPVLAAKFDASSMFASVRQAKGTIRRVDARNYASCADLPREPLILTHAIDDWPARRSWSSLEAMCERIRPDALFRAEASLCTLPTYLRYARHCAQDDSPLYLFHAAPLPPPLSRDFAQPRIFDEDLFAVLGDEVRPDHLWLIVGPERSGSTFHQDPNGTSAWNAVVSGAKAWVCFAPDIVPPGVRVSADWAEVETPLSVAGAGALSYVMKLTDRTEWLMSYLPAARTRYGLTARDPTCRGKLLEGVCEAGETFFVPSGWWHCAPFFFSRSGACTDTLTVVINLEPSIAITQNYVGVNELPAVLRFLRDRPEQISGLRGDCQAGELYDHFLAALDAETRERAMAAERVEKVVKSGFSFGFEVGEVDEEWML